MVKIKQSVINYWSPPVRISDALQGVHRLFLDTAPVIYLIEKNPQFLDVVCAIFEAIDQNQIRAVVSPVTLAECLVGAYRNNHKQAADNFIQYLTQGDSEFIQTSIAIANQAAQLHAEYHLQMTDALQIATAIEGRCEAFLTNDIQLPRVSEIRVLIIGDLR